MEKVLAAASCHIVQKRNVQHYFGSFGAFECPFQRAQNTQHYDSPKNIRYWSAQVELSDHLDPTKLKASETTPSLIGIIYTLINL